MLNSLGAELFFYRRYPNFKLRIKSCQTSFSKGGISEPIKRNKNDLLYLAALCLF